MMAGIVQAVSAQLERLAVQDVMGPQPQDALADGDVAAAAVAGAAAAAAAPAKIISRSTSVASAAAATATAVAQGVHDPELCTVCRLIELQMIFEVAEWEEDPIDNNLCQLCGERGKRMFDVQKELSVEQWMRVPVDEPHTACKDCLRGWIAAQTSELSVFIRCPFPNCKERMQLDDVHAVWPEKAFELQQRMEQDLGTSWREMTEAERSQIEAELPITVCPACELVFVKDEGCDTVVCLCGTMFCFVCKDTSAIGCACNEHG